MRIEIQWWERVRERFSEAERSELHRACTGETVCPPGLILDERELRPELRKKLEGLGGGDEAETLRGRRVLAANANG